MDLSNLAPIDAPEEEELNEDFVASTEEVVQEKKEPELSYEERARLMGHIPKDKFKGNPEDWVDAEEFVKRGDRHAGIEKERNIKLTAELVEVKNTLKKFSEHYENVERIAKEKALKELQAQKIQAKENLDFDQYEQIDQQIREAEKTESKTQNIDPVLADWHAKNKWYLTNQEMTRFADETADRIRLYRPGISQANLLAEVDKELRLQYKRADSSEPSVESSSGAVIKKQANRFENLPDEAKKSFNDLVKYGILKASDREKYTNDVLSYGSKH